MAKVPPPPPLANQDPAFNRWLLELTSILNASGGIDPAAVPGLDGVQSEIDTLQGRANVQAADIAQINVTLQNLLLRNQVFNGTGAPAAVLGIDGDWYYNRTGGAGARLYIHVGGSWVAQAI